MPKVQWAHRKQSLEKMRIAVSGAENVSQRYDFCKGLIFLKPIMVDGGSKLSKWGSNLSKWGTGCKIG